MNEIFIIIIGSIIGVIIVFVIFLLISYVYLKIDDIVYKNKKYKYKEPIQKRITKDLS